MTGWYLRMRSLLERSPTVTPTLYEILYSLIEAIDDIKQKQQERGDQ